MQEGVEQKDTIIKRLQEEVTATHEKNALVSRFRCSNFTFPRRLISHEFVFFRFLANKEPYRVTRQVGE